MMRINNTRGRFAEGDWIENELHRVVSKRLMNHIQPENADDVAAFNTHMIIMIKTHAKTPSQSRFSRLFS